MAPPGLAGRSVLDVAAGPSSLRRGSAGATAIHAVAVDPLYGFSTDTLTAHVQIDYARMLKEMHRREEQFRYKYFPTLAAAEASRRSAAARFLADYETGFVRSRYIGARLPRLPFADGAFDLVLCAHLLFIYARHLDYGFFTLCGLLASARPGERGPRGAPAPDLRPGRPALTGTAAPPGGAGPGRHRRPRRPGRLRVLPRQRFDAHFEQKPLKGWP